MYFLVQKVQKHLQTKEPLLFDKLFLQTWWKVYRREDGPESDRVFLHEVGVVREKIVLPNERDYRQKPVLVFTNTLRSRKGAAVNSRFDHELYVTEIVLQVIDWKYRIFGDNEDWDQ